MVVVSEAGWDNKGGGNYIKIRHSNEQENKTFFKLSYNEEKEKKIFLPKKHWNRISQEDLEDKFYIKRRSKIPSFFVSLQK